MNNDETWFRERAKFLSSEQRKSLNDMEEREAEVHTDICDYFSSVISGTNATTYVNTDQHRQ